MQQPISMWWHQFRRRHYTVRTTFSTYTDQPRVIWVCQCDRTWKR